MHGAAPDPLLAAHGGPGLYLHIPFCSAICPYCDFAVVTGGPGARGRLVDALIAEARGMAAPWVELAPGPPFDTVYFGGGTPSLLTISELARIIDAVRTHLPVADDAWLLLEANPEDATPANLAALHTLGVRTLSLGVQSFDAERLRFLGRRHDPDTARAAVRNARAAGFNTVSLDLIYGLPDDDQAAIGRDLETAIELAPDHLSCYQLSMPEATPFGRRLARGELRELGESGQVELFELVHATLGGAGYAGYEVSSFARNPGHRSRHNRKYWDHTPYLGLGPAAHSLAAGKRWWNHRPLATYENAVLAGIPGTAGEETLGPAELALEAVMLGLRTHAGLDLVRLRTRYGVDLLKSDPDYLQTLTDEGLADLVGSTLKPTLRGLATADAVAAGFNLGLETASPVP